MSAMRWTTSSGPPRKLFAPGKSPARLTRPPHRRVFFGFAIWTSHGAILGLNMPRPAQHTGSSLKRNRSPAVARYGLPLHLCIFRYAHPVTFYLFSGNIQICCYPLTEPLRTMYTKERT